MSDISSSGGLLVLLIRLLVVRSLSGRGNWAVSDNSNERKAHSNAMELKMINGTCRENLFCNEKYAPGILTGQDRKGAAILNLCVLVLLFLCTLNTAGEHCRCSSVPNFGLRHTESRSKYLSFAAD